MDKWVGVLIAAGGGGGGVDKSHCSLLDSRGHNPLFLSSCFGVSLVFYVLELFGSYRDISCLFSCGSLICFSFVDL